MKKIKLKLSLTTLVVVMTYTACNKSALNLKPAVVTADNYFTTEANFRSAIIGVYAALTDFYSSSNESSGGQAESEIQYLAGDDLTITSVTPYEVFTGITPNESYLNSYFASCYVLINRSNQVFQQITTAGPGVFTTTTPFNVKNANQGEMLFLRAFGYYQLWNIFGTAPVVTTVFTDLSKINSPGSTGTQLLDQAITDLTAATSLLPASWGSSDVGRVTANSAYGLLGKCLVFRATVNKSTADYTAAIAAFSKINGASLTANFEDNFNVNTENNSESLFEFQAGAPLAGPGATNLWLANDQANIGVASAYYESFIPGNFANYMGGGLWVATQKLINAFEPGDPRLPLTVVPGTNYLNKYVLNNSPESQNSLNNTRILRYADVLLLWAEADVQTGNAHDAVDKINLVRTRARNMVADGTVPENFDDTITDVPTIMGWVMDERLRELGSEAQRWYDIRRWALGGQITLTNAFFSSAIPVNMKWDSHYLYFPIPYSETSLDPNIKQNPGY